MLSRLTRGRGAILIAAALLLASASVAAAGVLEDQLAKTHDEQAGVRSEMVRIDARQQALVRQVSSLNARIRELDRPIGELSGQIDALETQLDHRAARVEELKVEFVRQRAEIARLDLELTAARDLLQSRLVEAYKQGDTEWIEHIAGAGTIGELIDRQEALGQVVGLDERVIRRIADTERAVRVERARNHDVQRRIAADIEQLDADKAELDSERAELQRRRDEVAGVRGERDAALEALAAREQKLGAKLDDLDEDAQLLKDAIASGTNDYSGLPGIAPNGVMWPVSGPVVSGFGWRWGRMHEGVDIAVPGGTPIHAAASGVVTYAGWMSGYGNLVLVQHSGVLSTAYAHQSRIVSSVGQTVGQGQLLGYVGCTGHCFGDHLHFETRESGAAVDPMRYL